MSDNVSTLTAQVTAFVIEHARVADGDSLLLIGEELEALSQGLRQSAENVKCETVPVHNAIAASKNWDLIWSLAMYVDHSSTVALPCRSEVLAVFRDQGAKRVLHVTVSDALNLNDWSLSDSLALGFSLLEKFSMGKKRVAIYEFDIEKYKSCPDWLNSRHWAHPQRWGDRKPWQ